MDQMGRDLHTPPSSLIFTALRRRKTYLQSVELFYGLILLAIVRVYTIEKQSAAPPESENSTSQTFTTLGKLNIQWAEKIQTCLGVFQLSKPSLATVEVVHIVWQNKKSIQQQLVVLLPLWHDYWIWWRSTLMKRV